MCHPPMPNCLRLAHITSCVRVFTPPACSCLLVSGGHYALNLSRSVERLAALRLQEAACKARPWERDKHYHAWRNVTLTVSESGSCACQFTHMSYIYTHVKHASTCQYSAVSVKD